MSASDSITAVRHPFSKDQDNEKNTAIRNSIAGASFVTLRFGQAIGAFVPDHV